MKKIIATALLAALGAFCTPAMAQWYIAGDFGTTEFDLDCSGTTSCDTSDVGYRIAGGYQLNQNFAFELSYFDLGKASFAGNVPPFGAVTGSVGLTGFSLSALGIVPINQFSIYGRLGIASVETTLDGAVAGLGSASDSETSTPLLVGFGAAYAFNKNFSARLEWSRTTAKFEDEEGDVDLLSLGLVYRF
jgi:OOP family OmpA-OmpF porin